MKDDRAQVPLGGAGDLVLGDRPSTPSSGAAGATAEAACGSGSGRACAALRQTKPIGPPGEGESGKIVRKCFVERELEDNVREARADG